MAYALVTDGAIFELFATRPVLAPGLQVAEVPTGAQVGWVTADGVAFAAPVAPALTTAQALVVLDAQAQVVEARGILFQAQGAQAPALLLTDVASQGKLTSAFVAASAGLWSAGTPWKMADGTFQPFSIADVIAAATFALGYVAACATAEATIARRLVASPTLDVTSPTMWPSNGPFLAPLPTDTASGAGSASAQGEAQAAVPVGGIAAGEGASGARGQAAVPIDGAGAGAAAASGQGAATAS